MKSRYPWLILCAVLTTSGCSSLGVKPWERNLLSRDDMLMDSDALDLAFDDLGDQWVKNIENPVAMLV